MFYLNYRLLLINGFITVKVLFWCFSHLYTQSRECIAALFIHFIQQVLNDYYYRGHYGTKNNVLNHALKRHYL